jgi:hypothetical protein
MARDSRPADSSDDLLLSTIAGSFWISPNNFSRVPDPHDVIGDQDRV